MDYSKMTQEDFSKHLSLVLIDITALQLITEVQSIYQDVAEHFNNDVLDSWANSQRKLARIESGIDD